MNKLNNNPFPKVISNTLNAKINDKPYHVDFDKIKDNQCGTLSWEVSKDDFNCIANTLSNWNELLEKQKVAADKIAEKINETLNVKIIDYLQENNISMKEWFQYGRGEHSRSDWKYYYKDILICGVHISTELFPGQTECKLSLEFY